MKLNCLAVLFLALPLGAQDDRIHKTDGSTIEGVSVTSFDIREVKYRKRGSNEILSSDKVVKVELGSFRDVFRLGLRDVGLMLTKAREQLAAKEPLLAQLGFLAAANMYFDLGQPSDAVNVLEEMEKAVPNAGVLPEIYRLKFEHYMGLGGAGARNAMAVARSFLTTAQGNAWPSGYATEAEFYVAMAERVGGGDPRAFRSSLEGIIERARVQNPLIANRASVQLANSLRESKDVAGARKIYESLAEKDNVDVNSRAGAYLGLGLLKLAEAGSDREANKQALLLFLRVYLETSDCWGSLQAEALYHAVLAAGRWRGADFDYVMARCRGVLKTDFPDSDWTKRALSGS